MWYSWMTYLPSQLNIHVLIDNTTMATEYTFTDDIVAMATEYIFMDDITSMTFEYTFMDDIAAMATEYTFMDGITVMWSQYTFMDGIAVMATEYTPPSSIDEIKINLYLSRDGWVTDTRHRAMEHCTGECCCLRQSVIASPALEHASSLIFDGRGRTSYSNISAADPYSAAQQQFIIV